MLPDIECDAESDNSRLAGVPRYEFMTSSGHVTLSVTSPFDSAWPLSYRLPIVSNPVSAVVSEIIVTHARRSLPNATQLDTPVVGWGSTKKYTMDPQRVPGSQLVN